MPAVSEGPGVETPDLPRTWRPLGVQVAGVFFFAMLLVVCVFAWVGFGQEVRDQFTLAQRATLIALGVGIGGVLYGMFRSRVTVSDDGVHVVNFFRSYTYRWDEVSGVRLKAGDPWAKLRLADGTARQVFALQSVDGGRADEAVRVLRAEIERR